MISQYLKTKLDIPATRQQFLRRKRLLQLLDNSVDNKAILVSAPAGYGKTSVISDWTKTRKEPFAWISLDESDNDPIRFLGYLQSALSEISPYLVISESHFSTYSSLSSATSLTILLNSLADKKEPLFIVLDDFHVITNPEIHEMMTFLIQYLAPGTNVIISTRSDPPLPLDKWRVNGQLAEIRQMDLCFSKADVSTLCNDLKGLNLSDLDVNRLTRKTEGWIAGLQIASLFLLNRKNKSEAILSFSGTHSHIMNYIVKEVIDCQSKSMRKFLIESSVLDVLSPELCDAVTTRNDCAELLDRLYSENQFVILLDNQNRQYRYHNLFSDALKSLLQRENPESIRELYLRASDWYSENDYLDEGIRFAFKGDDHCRAVYLIEQYASVALDQGERTTVWEWINQLAEETIRSRPILNLLHAWSIMNDKTTVSDELFEQRLMAAEQQIAEFECNPQDKRISKVMSLDRQKDTITLLKALFVFERGKSARSFLPEIQRLSNQSDFRLRSALYFLLARIHMRSLDYDSALHVLDDAASLSKKQRHTYLSIYVTYLRGWILLQKGDLHQALHVCQTELELLTTIKKTSKAKFPITSALNVIIGSVYLVWNRLLEAESLLSDSLLLLKGTTEIGIIIHALTKLISVRLALGRDASQIKPLITDLNLMERYYSRIKSLADALKIELSILMKNDLPDYYLSDRIQEFLKSDRKKGPQELSYYQNYDWHLNYTTTLIRLFIGQIMRNKGELDDEVSGHLVSWLNENLNNSLKYQLYKWTAELLVLKSTVEWLMGKEAVALTQLEKALALCDSNDAIRVFVQYQEFLRQMLKRIHSRNRFQAFISKVESEFQEFGSPKSIQEHATHDTQSRELSFDLSNRELEVLGLIAEGYSNREISSALFISLNTVKSHINHIFNKLDVKKRTKAVSIARESGLI